MNDRQYLKLAVEQAKKSVKANGFPAGAVIVKDGNIISEGISVGFINHDPTGHPETVAIREACRKLKVSNLEGAVMFESLECCNMCFSVAYWAGISKIVYACRKSPEMIKKFYYEGTMSNEPINESNNRKIELVFIPDFEQNMLEIIKEWEKKNG